MSTPIETLTKTKPQRNDQDIPRFKVRQIKSMDFQSELQSIYIYLLLHHNVTIEIGCPHRMPHLTKQFVKVRKIIFNSKDSENDVLDKSQNEINILSFIQRRAREQAQFEKISSNIAAKTAERRIQSTKRRECMRLFQDLLVEHGYFI